MWQLVFLWLNLLQRELYKHFKWLQELWSMWQQVRGKHNCVAGSCQCPSATSTLCSNGASIDTKSIERTAVPVATSVQFTGHPVATACVPTWFTTTSIVEHAATSTYIPGVGSHFEMILGSTVRKEVVDVSHHPNFPLVELRKYARTWILGANKCGAWDNKCPSGCCDKGICWGTQTDPNNCGRCHIARAPLPAKADNVSDPRAYWLSVVGDLYIYI